MDGPVSSLLRDAAAAPGSSYRKLAAKAIDPETGEQLSKDYVYDIARARLLTAPPPPRLRAIAACLGQDPEIIKQLAAAQWLDLHVRTETREGEWQLWTTVTRLGEEDREAIRQVAERLLAARGEAGPSSGPDGDAAESGQ